MNNLDLAYISGFFDGEGSIGVYDRNKSRDGSRRYYVLVVTLSQSGDEGLALLNEIQAMFGGSVSKKSYVNRQMWQLNLSADKGMDFLTELLPFLRLKKKQAELGITFQRLGVKSTLNEEAVDIARKLKELKK